MDTAIQRISLYPLDSAIGFPDTYLLDSIIYPVDIATHWISLQPLGGAIIAPIIGFPNTCLLDSDLSVR